MTNAFRDAAAALAVWGLAGYAAAFATLDGRVSKAVTRASVIYADIQLDAAPADGTPEFSTRSDLFGFFSFTELPAGAYTLTVSHRAYAPSVTSLTLADGEAATADISLVRTAGETFLSLHFDVICVRTGARLVDAVIAIYRADGSGGEAVKLGDLPWEIGGWHFSGLDPGFFRFEVTCPGWESLSVPASGLTYLGGDQQISMALKPVLTDLAVTVTGTKVDDGPPQGDVPLPDVQISITGLDPADLLTEVTGTRTVLPHPPGSHTFKDLPPLPYRLRVSRPGYVTHEETVMPGGGGTFAPVPVSLELGDQQITVYLDSVYKDPSVLAGAELELRGFDASSTEGISREAVATRDGEGPGPVSAVFGQLLPGRYWIHVKCTGMIGGLPPLSGGVLPGAPLGDTDIRVAFVPREAVAELLYRQHLDVPLVLEPVPAVIHGRLMVTDELTDPTLLGDVDPFTGEDPRIFLPVAQKGIQIEEHMGIDLLRDEFKLKVVDAAADGTFVAVVPPGRYGVRIPTMTDYTGHHCHLEFGDAPARAAPRVAGRRPGDLGWPFPDQWPWPDWSPDRHLGWLQVDSQDEPSLDLYAHRKYINILGGSAVDAKDPTTLAPITVNAGGAYVDEVVLDLAEYGSPMVTATGPVTQTVPLLPKVRFGDNPEFLLTGLTAGSYTITATHPRNTFAPMTLMIPAWSSPGDPPPMSPDPLDPARFEAGVTHSIQFREELHPTYASPGQVAVDFRRWLLTDVDSEGHEIYEYVPVTFTSYELQSWVFVGPSFSTLAFHAHASGPDNALWAPADGPFDVWVRQGWSGDNWHLAAGASAGTVLHVRDGGPDNNMFPGSAPFFVDGQYDAEIVAANRHYPEQLIADVSGTLLDGLTSFTTTADPDHPVVKRSAGDIGVSNVQLPAEWVYNGTASERVSLEPLPPRFRITIELERGMTVKGVVKDATGAALNNAEVSLLHRRSGNLLDVLSTEADGSFLFGNQRIQPVYVQVRVPGFFPRRQRAAPPAARDDPDLDLGDISLEPIPQPGLAAFTLDRHGLFIPGVLMSGDVDGFNPNNARDALTANWRVTASPATLTYTLPGFDGADGTPGPGTPISVVDEVTEVWLVDRRWFGKSPLADGEAASTPLDVPDPLTLTSFRKLQEDLTRSVRAEAPFFVIHQPGKPVPPSGRREEDATEMGGRLQLWELPAGDFEPRVFLVTKHGAVAAFDYSVPAGKKPLQGIRFPRWAATVLEIIGVEATFLPEINIAETVPAGRFVPLPAFESGIDYNQATGYLTYEYRIGVQVVEGSKAPAAGPLALAPKTLGLGFSGQVGFKVSGESSEVELLAVAAVEKDVKAGFEQYTPALLKAFTVDSAAASGTFKRSIVQNLNPGFLQAGGSEADRFRAPDYRYRSDATAFVKARLLRDLTPIISTFPGVGQFLGGLGRSGALVFSGLFDVGVGGGITRTSETYFPSPADFGSVVPGLGPPTWNMLGGGGQNHTVDTFNVQILAAAGIHVAALSNRVTGALLVGLGPPKNSVGQKGLKLTFNPEARWPLVLRVEGALRADGELGVNLWGMKLKRTINFKEWRIDWTPGAPDGGREAAAWFDIIPLNTAETIITTGLGPPAEFSGDGSGPGGDTILSQLDSSMSFAAAAGALLFASADSGEMALRFSRRSGEQWTASEEIARAAAVLGTAVMPLPGDRFLAVWTEIDAGDVGNPFPHSRVMFALGTGARAQWSQPVNLATVNGAATDLHLVPAGDEILLVFAVISGGPMSDAAELLWQRYDPAADQWLGAPAALFGPGRLHSWALAGSSHTGADTQAALIRVGIDGRAVVQRYLGTTWSPDSEVTDAARHHATAALAADGTLMAAVEGTEEGIGLWTFNDVSGTWQAVPDIGFAADAVSVLDLVPVDNGGDPAYFLLWGTGGDATRLRYAILASDGHTLVGPANGTSADPGTLDRLSVQALDGLSVQVLAAHSTADGSRVDLAILDASTAAPAGPVLTRQPQSKTLTEGSLNALSVASEHHGALAVEWSHDDRPVPQGEGDLLELAGVTADHAGVYRALLSDGNGITMSNPATVTVTDSFICYMTPGWNLLGIPAPTDRPLSDVLSSVARETPLYSGAAWAWNADNQRYQQLDPTAPPPAGRGFWVFSPVGGVGQPIAAAGAPVASTPRPGWGLLTPGAAGPVPPGFSVVYGWTGSDYFTVPAGADPAVFVLQAYWAFGPVDP